MAPRGISMQSEHNYNMKIQTGIKTRQHISQDTRHWRISKTARLATSKLSPEIQKAGFDTLNRASKSFF